MEPGSDRLLKRVWLVNGFILLALGVLALGTLLFITIGEFRGRSEPAVRVAGAAEAGRSVPRAIRYGAPVTVRGTTTQLVTVHHGEADQPETGGSLTSGATSGRARHYGADGPLVNVIFLTPGAPRGRLLLERPAIIQNFRYPPPEQVRDNMVPYAEPDALQNWIVYDITDRDTNGDGRLTSADRAALHVSALDGTGLRRVLTEPYEVISHAPTPDGRGLLVLALEAPKGKEVKQEEMRQRSFIYDMASGRLAPYAALDSAADRAARIVGR
ncbi:MAG TPA: hypothetical protein VF584_22760 [Longimicrobium sp.]|jgi:hypothetical protein